MGARTRGRNGFGMSFDVDRPPADPPANCRIPLLWRLARALWEEHRPDSTGFCVVSGCQHDNQLSPCSLAKLAMDGMEISCGNGDQPSSRPIFGLLSATDEAIQQEVFGCRTFSETEIDDA